MKEIEAAIKLVGDLIKMVPSPSTYPIRLALYELAMMVWDIVTKTHEMMAHTGFFSPHPESFYPDGELRLPNEIDLPLITLGGTVDSAFLAALARAFDPFGNLDTNPDVIGTGHSVKDRNYPYYPVLRYHTDGTTEGWEFRRPWAWPNQSPVQQANVSDTLRVTPTETYNPAQSFGEGPDTAFKPLSPRPLSNRHAARRVLPAGRAGRRAGPAGLRAGADAVGHRQSEHDAARPARPAIQSAGRSDPVLLPT